MDNLQTATLIAVDIGNSSMHFGLFRGGQTESFPVPSLWLQLDMTAGEFTSLLAWLPPQSPPWVVASVNREGAGRLFDWISQSRPDVKYRMLDHTQLPIELGIEYPHTAGLDRLAAAVAVNGLREPGRPAIVVDFGTAITVDAIAADGTFLGGAILPGINLAAAALVAGTSQLPPVDMEFRSPPRAIGKSTEPAIRGGLFWGAVGAVRHLVERASEELGAKPLVVITGGGADLLLPYIDPEGEYLHAPHLVLSGIAMAARGLEQRTTNGHE
jgi:type III pantothenate kinase